MNRLTRLLTVWQTIDLAAGANLTWPYVAAHECCHYVTARLLGLPARLEIGQGRVTYTAASPHDRRIRLAILAPALAGCLSLAALLWLSIAQASWTLFWLGLTLHLFWWFLCLADLADLQHYYRHGRWPEHQPPARQTIETWFWSQMRRLAATSKKGSIGCP